MNSTMSGTSVFSDTQRRHYCGIFRNEPEQFSTVVPYLLEGLRRNDRCVVVANRIEKTDLMERVAKAVPVDEARLQTQITFLDAEEVYLRDGRFDVERMLRFVSEMREESLRAGYAGLTATGEMTWAGEDVPGAKDLFEYEARINFMYPESSADILCQYPEDGFDPAALVNAIRTHPKVIVRGNVCGNPYYLPPDGFIAYLSGSVTQDVFDRMEKELFSRSVMAEIGSLDARELRRARMCLDVLDDSTFSDLQERLQTASFFHELALGTCADGDTAAHIRSADSRCRDLMDRLDAIRAFRRCMDAPAEWVSLEETVSMASELALGVSRTLSPDLGRYKVFASQAAYKALAALISAVAERSPSSAPIAVKATETEFGLVVTVEAAGPGVPEGAKESLFSSSEPCVCGRSLFLAREILESTGISVREIGLPGRSTVFEMHFPQRKYRAV